MSDENVEFVRRSFEVVARAFNAYWQEPRSITRAIEADDLWPEWRDLFELPGSPGRRGSRAVAVTPEDLDTVRRAYNDDNLLRGHRRLIARAAFETGRSPLLKR